MRGEAGLRFLALRQETIQALREAIIEQDAEVEEAFESEAAARAYQSQQYTRLRDARKDREMLIEELRRLDPSSPVPEGGGRS